MSPDSAASPDLDPDLVSIVTPAYRVAHVVGETIESVLAQTHVAWEMVVSDDCSPDDTREVLARWAARDPRIRLAPMEANGGPAAARNRALSAARGRYVAFLDSDDLWLPRKLELQLALMKRTGAPLSYTAFRRIDATGARTGELVRVPESLTYRTLLGNNAIAMSTAMVDRAATGPIRMKPVYYDDYACWLEILRAGGTARGLQEDLMRYRVLPKSVSRNKAKSALETWRTFRHVEGLGLAAAGAAFVRYAVNGVVKYRRF